MKKLLLMLFIAALFCSASNAQSVSTENVPKAVMAQFKIKFPDAVKANWEMENGNAYEANFISKNMEMAALFSNDGKWMETETYMDPSDLPDAVQSMIANEFDGADVLEASMIESLTNGIGYEVEMESQGRTMSVLFSADGAIISKKALDDDDDQNMDDEDEDDSDDQ